MAWHLIEDPNIIPVASTTTAGDPCRAGFAWTSRMASGIDSLLQGDIYDEGAGESVTATSYTPPYSQILNGTARHYRVGTSLRAGSRFRVKAKTSSCKRITIARTVMN